MINLGNFGNLEVQRPDATRPVQQPSVGAAISNIGKMVGNLSQQLEAEKAELNKARGGTLLADARVKAHELQVGLTDRVNRGEVKPEDMMSEYQAGYAALQERLLDGQDDSLRQLVADPMANMFKVSEIGVFDAAQAKVRDGFEAEMVSARGSFQQLALSDPAGASTGIAQVYSNIGPKAGWDQAKIAAAVQKDTQAFYTNSKLNWAGQNESMGDLKAEEARLSDDGYLPELGDNRVRYRDYVQTRIRELKSAKEARTRDWEVGVTNQMRMYGELLENGGRIPPGVEDDIVAFSNSIKGTKYAPVFRAMQDENKETRTMAMAPVGEQVRQIEKVRAAAIDNPDNPESAVAAKKKLERMQANLGRNLTAIKADPYGYAANVHGIEIAPLNFAADMSGQLALRERQRAQVQARTGVNPGLFTDAEAGQMVTLMDTLPAAQQEGMFKLLAGTGRDTQAATLKQIGKTDPVKMYAGAHALANHSARVNGVANRSVGRILLEGQQLIGKKQMELAKGAQAKIDQDVTKYVGSALAHDPDAFAGVAPMVTAFLAFQQKDRGTMTMNPSAQDIKDAVDIVTGGVVEINGSATILPYGMTAGNFKQAAPVAITKALSGLGYSADQRNKMIETVTLKPSDKQEEFFLFNGRSPIVGKDGQPVRVRVR